ncbi:MAG TPA: NTP transferase domain-containing protein [Acidimicrobiales bacterium]|nr:NTP transferase domain-containing protein [Acidimicrobiales bacterium]
MVVAGVVLAGGAGRRMGGLDKAALQVGGIALLDRVLAAARPVCDRLVVVGPTRPTDVADVEFVREAVPGGGPVPAIIAGVDAAGPECDVVLLLAVDLPLLTAVHLRHLVAALGHAGAGAAVSAEEDGPNPLLAAYRMSDLSARAAGLGPGAPARRLLPADPVMIDLGAAGLNVNRPEDLTVAEILAANDDQPPRSAPKTP